MNREDVILAIEQNNDSSIGLDFSNVNLSGAILDGLNLEGIIFDNAKLIGTSMINTNLKECRFRNSDLTEARLWFANLEKANMQGAILRRVDLLDAKLNETDFGRQSLFGKILQEEKSEFEEAQYVYITLRRNFSSVGRHDDVSWAYFKERQMERKSLSLFYYWAKRKPGVKEDSRKYAVWLANIPDYIIHISPNWIGASFKEIFWGYGERPLNIFILSIVIIAVFSFVFRATGGLQANYCLNWIDYFDYSFASFVASSHARILPATQSAQLITSLETALGITALTMLLFSIGQKLSMR